MAAYAVFEPPMRNRSAADHTDRFVFVREGFSFGAFLFGALWMLWRRLWLALIIYVAFVVILQVGLLALGLPASTRVAVHVLIHILLGMEASSLRRWTLMRRGWRDCGVVIADDLEMAERRFFDTRVGRPAVAVPATAAARAAPMGPAGSDIIGLFPEPGGGR
jgi:Protein of unknown function (DUF2628)